MIPKYTFRRNPYRTPITCGIIVIGTFLMCYGAGSESAFWAALGVSMLVAGGLLAATAPVHWE